MVTKKETWRGGINQELEMNIHTVLYLRETTSQDLLYNTGNSTQFSLIPYMRKESGKE